MAIKTILFLLTFGFTCLIIESCDNSSSQKVSSINDVSLRDTMLISKYHEECLNHRGKNHFFIPKEEINSILKTSCTDSVAIKDVTKGDLVLFIDSIGNVVYQARIHNTVQDKIYVECLDLKTHNFYISKLDVDSIHDLINYQNVSIKIFR